MAARALGSAVNADNPATAAAAGRTVAAKVVVASTAVGRVIDRSPPPAVVALSPLPLTERDVGAAGVVGLENLSNQDEEVVQPPFLDRCADRSTPLSLAQRAILDVRVDHVRIAAGGTGSASSHNLIGLAASQFVDRQDDLEWSQRHAFQ